MHTCTTPELDEDYIEHLCGSNAPHERTEEGVIFHLCNKHAAELDQGRVRELIADLQDRGITIENESGNTLWVSVSEGWKGVKLIVNPERNLVRTGGMDFELGLCKETDRLVLRIKEMLPCIG